MKTPSSRQVTVANISVCGILERQHHRLNTNFKACIVKKTKNKKNTLLLIGQSQYFAQVEFCHVSQSCVKPSYVTDVKETGVSAGCRWGALWMVSVNAPPSLLLSEGAEFRLRAGKVPSGVKREESERACRRTREETLTCWTAALWV